MKGRVAFAPQACVSTSARCAAEHCSLCLFCGSLAVAAVCAGAASVSSPFPCVALSRCVSDAASQGSKFHSRGSPSACCAESAAILEELRLECWTELMDMNALAIGLIFRHPDNAQVPCSLCQGVAKLLSEMGSISLWSSHCLPAYSHYFPGG